jgi:SagB-type dehydrogenase family enzyme
MSGIKYRRAQSLVCYWRDHRLIVHNYITNTRVAADTSILAVLQCAQQWVSAGAVSEAIPGVDLPVVQQALDRLVQLSLLDSSLTRNPKRDAAVRQWDSWAPEAALLHFGIRDVPFTDFQTVERRLHLKASVDPPPPPVKSYDGVDVVALPPAQRHGELARNLLARRTWRRFGAASVTKSQLATLLGLTWGVQAWVGSRARQTLAALKTAPSGGARHSIEAYVLARRVNGVPAGLYHYHADRHQLEAIGSGAAPGMANYVPQQAWYDDAAALVVMTSIFERSRWRYGYARAYRSIMFEAGHHCQTFLLLATSLGLAPFCTGALADSLIERDLGIDGISESVLYACGVGVRPPGVEWAPSPDARRVVTRRPPSSAGVGRARSSSARRKHPSR